MDNLNGWIDSASQILPRLGAAIVVFLLFWFSSRILRRLARRFGANHKLSPDLINLLGQVSETSMLIFGIVSALGTLGIDVGAMIAGLGLVGFALGFALKDLLSNFLSGFLILLYNPFVRGDHIRVGVNEGKVVEINMRYTVLQAEGKEILIPNASLFSDAVIVHRAELENRKTEPVKSL